jgi:polyprenyl-phospho-N-acetylgalactosaminyl synthase
VLQVRAVTPMDTASAESGSSPAGEVARCAVVVPAYNEEPMIGQVIREVRRLFPWVVVVDDGSADNTAGEARAAGAIVLRHPVNVGQGGALETGIRFALASGAEFFITMDADGQHQPSDAVALLSRLQARRTELDMVLGSRFLGQRPQMGFRRRLLLRAATRLSRLLHGLPLTDTHNGLRVFGRNVAERMRFNHVDMAHASDVYDIIRKYRFRFEEYPVTIRYTHYSRSKGQSMVNAINVLIDLLFNRVK